MKVMIEADRGKGRWQIEILEGTDEKSYDREK